MLSNRGVLLMFIFLLIIIIMLSYYDFNSYENFNNNSKLNLFELLGNGSFNNGNNVNKYFQSSGVSIKKMYNNPDCNNSLYVLELKGKGYYTMKVNLKGNFNYKLTLWVNSQTNNFYKNLLNVYTGNFKVSCDTDDGINIKELVIDEKNVKGVKWYLYEYKFNTIDDGDYYLNILCNKNNDNVNLNITGLMLKPYLPLDLNFDATINLVSYLDAENKNSCNPSLLWNDLSNKDARYIWDTKPTWNTDGYYKTINNKLTGPSMYDLGINYMNESDFTLILESKNLHTDNDGYVSVIRIKGNQDVGLELLLPKKNGKMILDLGGKKYTLPNAINTTTKYIYTFVHNNSNLDIWLNEDLFSSIKNIPKLYFENNNIIINPTEKWNANIYSLLLYNSAKHEEEIKYINNYLTYHPKKKDKNINLPNMLPLNSNPMQPLNPPIQPLNPPMQPLNPPMQPLNPPMQPLNPPMQPLNPSIESLCPSAFYREGNYYINIPKGSKYSKKLGYGLRNYGNDKERAHEIYKMNFPDCKIPDILKFNPPSNCPFIISKNNPCQERVCRNVKWDANNFNDMNINKHCRKHVSHYCRINKGIDPACYCWEDRNIYNKRCMDYRKHYEPPNEYGCRVDVFKISEHPDYRNYVRKDKIPCWNCNLDSTIVDNSVVNKRNYKNM